MKMVRELEEQAESKGHQYDQQLQLNHTDPVSFTEEGEVVPGDKLKTRVKKNREWRMEGVVKTSRMENGRDS